MNTQSDTTDRLFAEVQISMDTRGDGSTVLSNSIGLNAPAETLVEVLEAQAKTVPNNAFFKEKQGKDWAEICYAEFLDRAAQRARQLLSTTSTSKDAPLLLLAPNSIDHAITAFAAMAIGVPVAPISPAYGLNPAAHGRLAEIVSVLKPAAAYIADTAAFGGVVSLLAEACHGQVFAPEAGPNVQALNSAPLADLETYKEARAAVEPDSVAKILFTSGSTGMPKGVINTHRMLCSNQRALAQIWPFLTTTPPVLLDWLPWSHTFGGNVSVNATLFNGGTLCIDGGKPAPGLINTTLQNMLDVAPTLHLNVPAGIEALLPHLESDRELSARFFSNLTAIFVAAAALPQQTRDRLKAVWRRTTGPEPVLLAGWGSTETAPFSTAVYYPTDRADAIGLPMPGTKIKLTPDQSKLALSVKGPNVTPGYWRNETATQAAFDTEGYYQMGDAGQFIAPQSPEAGIRFDGRLSENFKLRSGTWVNVGMLRVKLLGRLGPEILDVVLTGHNQTDIGLLLVPNLAAACDRHGLENTASVDELFATESFQEQLVSAIADHNSQNRASSTAIQRVAVLPRVPDIGRGEITDKGYINQRAMLSNWANLVERLHQDGPLIDPENMIVRLKRT